jgi:hypothetical protein
MNRRQEILNLVNILATPTDVYRELHENPRWRMPLILLATSSLLLGWLMIPAVLEPMKKIFVASFGQDASAVAVQGVMKAIAVTLLVGDPFLKVIRWLVVVTALYCMARLSMKGHEPRFRELFSAVAYTETIFILMSVLTTLIIYSKGINAIESPKDLVFFKGLEYFLAEPDTHPVLATVLSNFNPFSCWYVLSIALGLRVITGFQFSKSLLVAGMSWIIWISISIIQPEALNAIVSLVT